MENASKALLIAGAMLLMILVLTFAIYLFTQMAADTADMYGKMSENEIVEFNQEFFNYENKELTIQDVVSIINLAKNRNQKGKTPVTVTVKLDSTDNMQNNADVEGLLKDNMEKKYSCTVNYANNSELVGSIIINTLSD